MVLFFDWYFAILGALVVTVLATVVTMGLIYVLLELSHIVFKMKRRGRIDI